MRLPLAKISRVSLHCTLEALLQLSALQQAKIRPLSHASPIEAEGCPEMVLVRQQANAAPMHWQQIDINMLGGAAAVASVDSGSCSD
jgi:hypothetical protein